jgi:hypothetical protein
MVKAFSFLLIVVSVSAQFTACMYGNMDNTQRCGVCFEGGCPGDQAPVACETFAVANEAIDFQTQNACNST